MPRSSFDYTQLGIGICGHVVNTWPQICELGGRNPEVVCETCTRIQWDLGDDVETLVWIRLKPKPAKTVPAKAKKTPKPKKLSPFAALVQEELF